MDVKAVKKESVAVSHTPSIAPGVITAKPQELRSFAPKKVKKNDFDRMVDSAGFVLIMGILITATGMVCYFGFFNRFSFYTLDIGFSLCIYSFAVKLVDLMLKITGVRK